MGEEFWEVTFYLTVIFGIIGFYFFWRVWPWLSTPFREKAEKEKRRKQRELWELALREEREKSED